MILCPAKNGAPLESSRGGFFVTETFQRVRGILKINWNLALVQHHEKFHVPLLSGLELLEQKLPKMQSDF